MLMFLLGFYTCGTMISFLIIGFFACLGGKNSDLWKPFVYAPLWFVTLPLFFTGRLG